MPTDIAASLPTTSAQPETKKLAKVKMVALRNPMLYTNPMPKGPQGQAFWRYDESVNCWYVGLHERANPPYRTQVVVEAVLDLDENGHLAGIEIVMPNHEGRPISPPPSAQE